MIDRALRFVADQLNASLPPDPGLPVLLQNIAHIDQFQNANNHIIASVVNIEAEKALKNQQMVQQLNRGDGNVVTVVQRAPVFLNIYILFSAYYTDTAGDPYQRALRNLSAVVGFFQQHPVFHRDHYPQLAADDIEKVIMDLYSMRMEELNHLWGVLGSKYYPSALYKMRLVIIQTALPTGGDTIRDLETKEKNQHHAPQI